MKDGGEVKEVKVQLGPRKNAKVSDIFRVGVGLIVDFDGVFWCCFCGWLTQNTDEIEVI